MSQNAMVPVREYAVGVVKESGRALYQVGEGLLILVCAAASPLIYLAGLAWFGLLKGRSNCLVWALWQKAKNRRRKVVRVKNACGRSHWQVIGVDGSRWEWYAKGASQRIRLSNLWYRGEAKKVGNQ